MNREREITKKSVQEYNEFNTSIIKKGYYIHEF